MVPVVEVSTTPTMRLAAALPAMTAVLLVTLELLPLIHGRDHAPSRCRGDLAAIRRLLRHTHAISTHQSGA